MKLKADLMDGEDMKRALKRMSHQILERNYGAENLIFLGIKRRGMPLAHILSENISQIEGVSVPVFELDVSPFRDDIAPIEGAKELHKSQSSFSLEGKDVVLVDDVIYTGRTARAALDACSSYGRAKSIQLACLIDRGHRELPIRADYIGKNIPTSKSEIIAVYVSDVDGDEGVKLYDL